jgi:hypothetical protein
MQFKTVNAVKETIPRYRSSLFLSGGQHVIDRERSDNGPKMNQKRSDNEPRTECERTDNEAITENRISYLISFFFVLLIFLFIFLIKFDRIPPI